jgi:hypothetical protein
MRQRGAAACSADAGRKPRADFLIACMAERVRERNLKSRIAFQATAGGGDGFAVVLEFKFLSRKIASMQSMSACRQKWRQSFAVGPSAAVRSEAARRENFRPKQINYAAWVFTDVDAVKFKSKDFKGIHSPVRIPEPVAIT